MPVLLQAERARGVRVVINDEQGHVGAGALPLMEKRQVQVEWILVASSVSLGFGDVPKKGASPRRGRDTSEGVAQGQVDEIVVRVFAEDGALPPVQNMTPVDAFQ